MTPVSTLDAPTAVVTSVHQAAAVRAVTARCPSVAPAVIRAMVDEEFAAYTSARVREFVPLFVARTVIAQLNATK